MHVNLQLTTNARSDANNNLVEMQLTMRPPKGPDLPGHGALSSFEGFAGGEQGLCRGEVWIYI